MRAALRHKSTFRGLIDSTSVPHIFTCARGFASGRNPLGVSIQVCGENEWQLAELSIILHLFKVGYTKV